jgi:hypothetical protein
LATISSGDSPSHTQQHHVRTAATLPLNSSQQQRRPPRQQTQQQQRQPDDSAGGAAADAAGAAGDADDDVSSGEELDGLGELGSSDNEGERFLQVRGLVSRCFMCCLDTPCSNLH